MAGERTGGLRDPKVNRLEQVYMCSHALPHPVDRQNDRQI